MSLEAFRKSWPVTATLRFAYQALVAAHWVWSTLLRPVTHPLTIAAKWVMARYMRLWDRVVYTREGYFSRTRAGVLLASTVAFVWVLPSVLLFVAQLGLFAATYKNERIILTKSQEIYADENIHSVTGCESSECNADNAVYFRVRPTGFNQLWSLVARGSLFYPDYVVGSITNAGQECTVISYGIRIKALMRNWDIYPDLLLAQCSFTKKDA